jgi:hypothetical protein
MQKTIAFLCFFYWLMPNVAGNGHYVNASSINDTIKAADRKNNRPDSILTH